MGERFPSSGGELEGLSNDVRTWASTELQGGEYGWSGHGPFAQWHQYKNVLEQPAPRNLKEFARTHPNLDPTLTRLHEAKHAFLESSYTTPKGINIGEAMHLTAVPWQDIRNHLREFDTWLKRVRDIQGVGGRDHINPDLLTPTFWKQSNTTNRSITIPKETTEYLC